MIWIKFGLRASTADANRSGSLSRNTRFLEVMLVKGNKIRKIDNLKTELDISW